MDFIEALAISAACRDWSQVRLRDIADLDRFDDRSAQEEDQSLFCVDAINPAEAQQTHQANLQALDAARSILIRTIAMVRSSTPIPSFNELNDPVSKRLDR